MFQQSPQYYPNYYNVPQQYQQSLSQQYLQNIQRQQEDRYGFITVNSEQQARDWPIAPGNSLTFKDESAPYIYTKTMGLSQFETPIFERYRLTKEENVEPVATAPANDTILSTVQQYSKDYQEKIEMLEKELENVKADFITMQQSYQALQNEFSDIQHWLQQPLKENKNGNKKDREG